MIRLFVGLALPDAVRGELAYLQAGLPGAKWVKAESLHLTLKFIGEVDRGVAEDIDTALGAIHTPSFSMVLSGLGCFESKGKVRALWARVSKSQELKRLQEKIESALVRAGLEPERRKFKPHITLARFKNGTPAERIGMFLENNNTFQTDPFPIEHFTLFRSHLGGDGSVYEPLAEYPLLLPLETKSA